MARESPPPLQRHNHPIPPVPEWNHGSGLDALNSREEAAAMVGAMANWTRELELCQARRDKEMLAVTEAWQPRIDALNAALADCRRQLEEWARQNRNEFGEAQSLDLPAGTLMFRKGNRSLELLGGWTWEKVLAKMKGKRWLPFIRIKREVDKSAILRAEVRSQERGAPDLKLRTIGLKVAREERFSIDLRPEAVPAVTGGV